MMKRSTYLAAASTVLAIGALTHMSAGTSATPQSSLVLLDGSRTSTAALHGQVALASFWAASCAACVAEMPKMVATYEKYHARGFDTVAVAMSYDPPSYVVNYAETRKLPFKVAIDNTGTVARQWGQVKLTPTTFVVDKRGQVVAKFTGEPDSAALHMLIEKLLAPS